MLGVILWSGTLCGGCLRVPVADATAPALDAPSEQSTGPVVLWPGRDPGTLYPKGEIRGFRIEQGGQLIGRSWGRYVGADADGHHVFETRIELLPPSMDPVRSEGRLVIDADGDLVTGYERSGVAELSFVRDGEKLTISDGTVEDELQFADGTAYLAHGALLHTEMMFGLRRLVAGELSWRVVSLSGGPPFEWSAEVEVAAEHPGQTTILLTNLGERITLLDGRLIELETTGAAQRVVQQVSPSWPSWTIEPPKRLVYTLPADATFRIESLEIEGREGEPTLAGELLLPQVTEPGPGPAVLFLARMAGEDRYGFSGPPAADIGSHEIHDALAQAGFVVLRFDERGSGRSEPATASYDGQLHDARRAYAALLLHAAVDPTKVIVIGHGEGALRALTIGATEGEHLAGIALLASPGRRYAEILRYQAEVRLAGAPPLLRTRALEAQETMISALLAGETPPELAQHAQWLREIFAVNPSRLVSRLRAPLLLVQGDKDFEVDAQRDLATLVRAAKKHKIKHRVARYPELDHLLKHETGISKPERYRQDRRVDADFIADLVAWARGVTGQ